MLTARMRSLESSLVVAALKARQAWLERKFEVKQTENTRASETMDYFSILDAELDEVLIESLKTADFEIDGFLTEEGAKNAQCNYSGVGRRAVIDSLDGSSNFLSSRTDFGISVAVEKDGVSELGGIITPVRGELIIAAKGQGTHFFQCYGSLLNTDVGRESIDTDQNRCETSLCRLPQKKTTLGALKTTRLYVHTGKRRNFELAPDDPWNTIYAKLANPGCSFACSVALLETALGKLDGAAIGFQNYWDFAAGRLLVEEAGGYFEAWDLDWNHILSTQEIAKATATKKDNDDVWLAHVLAAGTKETMDALRGHFLEQD